MPKINNRWLRLLYFAKNKHSDIFFCYDHDLVYFPVSFFERDVLRKINKKKENSVLRTILKN